MPFTEQPLHEAEVREDSATGQLRLQRGQTNPVVTQKESPITD